MILLVVDTQKAIMRRSLYHFSLFKSRVCQLIQTARCSGIEIIYVRHNGKLGSPMAKGNEGFEIYEDFAPAPGERIFDKQANSAFKDTGLQAYLREKGETAIIIAGLQTDYCIDATIKAGFEHGFKMIVPEGCNTTFPNRYMSGRKTYRYYNDFLWKNRYAECISFAEVIARLEK